MTTEHPKTSPAATPDNTPIPGGGSWHWDYAACAWVENQPCQTFQPGDVTALSTELIQE